ncbi:hypothetical protein SUGI_0800360 [Cryptomeria japonica]|nr:hypothetical protein SUGI_0800360 [Cryptomeria japonica]
MMLSSKSMEKMRAIVKKWRRFAKIGVTACSKGTCDTHHASDHPPPHPSCEDRENLEEVSQDGSVPNDFVPVYVGQTRRRYIISSKNLNHPLLRILIKRSEEDHHDGYRVACEVVLFDHLLWMLKNEDPLLSQTDSLEELVDFYAC